MNKVKRFAVIALAGLLMVLMSACGGRHSGNGAYYAADSAKAEEAAKELNEKASKKGYVERSNKETSFKYHVAQVNEPEDYDDEVAYTDDDYVIGIRPEFVEISKDAKFEGEVYSSMPTGMETTVRVAIGNYLLTGVMFGGVVYKLGDKVKVGFKGNNAILFDRKSSQIITLGSLKEE